MALQRLLDGFARFRTQYYPKHKSLYEKLARDGQAPEILVVACSDARVDPAILTQTGPGDLFVVRNVAAIVPPRQRDRKYHGTSSAVEFAVRALQVEHVVILGHALCGGLGALIDGKESPFADYDFLLDWMHIAQPAKDAALAALPADAPKDKVRRVIEQASVLNTVANLMTFDWVAERVEAGNLSIHAWYFDMTAAQLWAFDPIKAEFFPVLDNKDVLPTFGEAVRKLTGHVQSAPGGTSERKNYLSRFVEVAAAGF